MTSEVPSPPSTPVDRQTRSLGVAIARYGLARAALVGVLTALLVLVGVPFLVALLVALVVALPLSLLLFRTLRHELDQALAEAGQRRKVQKARLRAQLRGEAEQAEPVGSVQGEPDRGTSSGPDEPSGTDVGSAQDGHGQADSGAEGPDQHDHRGVAEHGDQFPAPDSAAHPPQR